MAEKTETKTENLEREYTIPLRNKWTRVPSYKRANKAIKAIKEFLVRHMKIRDRDLKKIRIDKYLNEVVWFRGIKNPPNKIKVKVKKEGEIVRVELSEMPQKLKFKKLRLEKRETKAMQSAEKKKSMMDRAKESMQKTTEKKPEQEQISEEKKVEEEKKEEIEKKEEEKEKKAAVVEAGKEMEKAAGKEMKRMKSQKTTKQPKHQQRKALAK